MSLETRKYKFEEGDSHDINDLASPMTTRDFEAL